MLVPFYIFAWATSILYGVEAILVKLVGKHSIPNPWLFNFIWTFFIVLFTVPTAIANGVGIPHDWTYVFWGSIFYAAASLFYILGIYKLDVSIVGPLFNFRTAISVILGALFLGEILTMKQYILIAIIFMFGIVVSLDEKFSIRSFFRAGVGMLLLCIFSIAITGVFIKKAIPTIGYWETTLWLAVLGQVWLLGTLPLFKKDLLSISPRQYGFAAVTAGIETLGMLASNAAYATNISISTAIISLPFSLIFAFVFSRISPKLLENHTFKVYMVRFVGAAIMVLAALNL